jgi:hypothetical protein
MNVRLIAAIFILGVTLVFADDDDKPISTPSGIPVSGTVFLSTEVQSVSGLETLTLLTVSHHTEFVAYGKAVNILPLLELRHRYLLTLSEQRGAVARFRQADQSIKRQQYLYREGATSKRNLQSQQAQWQTDKAQVDVTDVQGKAIVDEARLLWGKKLTDWALSIDSELLDAFLSGRKALLQVTLPADKQLAKDIKSIDVEASGKRSAAIKAELVSAALQTDTVMQGESYFFQADGGRIRAGMRVAAWIPEQGEIQSGVVIPKSALVWHLDQAFVYVKSASEQFSRRNIEKLLPAADGYFVKNGLDAGDQLVITGGQMLLSEEFKGQIPNEDD